MPKKQKQRRNNTNVKEENTPFPLLENLSWGSSVITKKKSDGGRWMKRWMKRKKKKERVYMEKNK